MINQYCKLFYEYFIFIVTYLYSGTIIIIKCRHLIKWVIFSIIYALINDVAPLFIIQMMLVLLKQSILLIILLKILFLGV